MPFTMEQQLYIFRKMLYELLIAEHSYDAVREFAWYTGYWPNLMTGEFSKIDRDDGAFSCYRCKPHIELTKAEARRMLKDVI